MDRTELINNMWNADTAHYYGFLKIKGNERYNLAKYFLHTHTDYGSPKDSILTVKKYVSTACEMGARAIAVSDHGTMYAVQPLYNECKEKGLKLIVGVEFYVCDTVEDKNRKKHTRLHLCGYAKNKEGYLALSRLITESNERMIVIHTQDGDLTYPCISKKLLETYIGPDSKGHGNVILTSACVGGVLSGISFANETLRMNIEDLENKISIHKDAVNKFIFAENALQRAEAEKLHLAEITGKNYTKRINALKRNPDPEEEKRIAMEKEESQQAAARIKELAGVIKQAKTMKTESQKILDAASKVKYCELKYFQKFIENEEREVKKLNEELVPEEHLMESFEREAVWYDNLAGHGNWYIELQYHKIPIEKKLMPYLVKVARKYNIPLVAANDAHMATRDDAIIRKYINSLRFNKWEALETGDDEMYLKDDVSLFHSLISCVDEEAAWEAMENREKIVEACNLELKKENNYPKYVA